VDIKACLARGYVYPQPVGRSRWRSYLQLRKLTILWLRHIYLLV